MSLVKNVVSFYGNPQFFTEKKKQTVTELASLAYKEGKLARKLNIPMSENPYPFEDNEAVWNKHDCWVEGWKSMGDIPNDK